jgi:hypothetical protein
VLYSKDKRQSQDSQDKEEQLKVQRTKKFPSSVAGDFFRSYRRDRALGSTQPLKMSTKKTPGGEDGRCVSVTTLPSS